MEKTNNFMDILHNSKPLGEKRFLLHTGAIKRRYRLLPKLSAVGYLPRKKDWVNTAFSTYNYSFIRTGSGTYEHSRSVLPVNGPMVLTQRPDRAVSYGAYHEWEELFLIYDRNEGAKLTANGLFPHLHDSPLWDIYEKSSITPLFRKFISEIEREVHDGDMLDLTAYELILAVKGNHGSSDYSTEEETLILNLEKHLRQNLHTHVSAAESSQAVSMHPAKFRRKWKHIFGISFNRYLMQVRLERGAKLLAESSFRIQDIAEQLGYQDSLYFSRLFRREYGIPPREYREIHRLDRF